MKFPRIVLALFMVSVLSTSYKPQKNDYPVYNGNDLGVNWSPEQTVFKIWAPTAAAVKLRLYAAGDGGKPLQTINLSRAKDGVWETTVKENLKNQYYTFQASINGRWLKERPDIYAKAVGVNGQRGMVADLASTNPKGWALDKKPGQKNFTDIMIYELHVRDLSMDPNSGITHKGKFLGLAETKTKSPDGTSTGLDHIKSLGVTHIHLLPSFDYNSVDETKPEANQYNWGYDPLNYNVPEGSYSTDAFDGNVRIREFKKMVQTLHANGLRVILDVVYNHTSDTASNFNQFVPGYFYRHTEKGAYSNATACGNETASEKAMMRKYMIESVVYWAKEYHLDGFRFDLMGVHDIETMNDISAALHKIDPTIFIYGEGWTAGNSPLPEDLRAVKKNAYKLDKIAVFNDDMRDGIKGGWSDVKSKGFVSGAQDAAESVKFGIVGSVKHPQVDYSKVNYSKAPWAAEPYQTINYVSCHDDNTLWDRLKISNPDASEKDLIKMDKLANTIVFTSQGVAFMHAGAEMLRTKKGIPNSYNSPDAINELDWSRKSKYKDVFNYYKTLIALRKHHPAFRMPSAKMIREHLKFMETADPDMIAYQISGNANGDTWKNILVIFNGSLSDGRINIPEGRWRLVIDGKTINEKSMKAIGGGQITVPATSAWLLYEL
ncbi:type I pullulanase [Mucilaginibacter ginsenosidivorans]|uniref:Type I pullulanase n=1 Tax=Mucilaginibacter ginsenosidivorans TaxID=398053 RepID=A0A5B8URR7_9SPHI|nr:type I pullulanase [Mucilaginibacter ginsenosidivorans]QEC61649.1 type I pullulanase [Mucilaginibacter ginsenosidivorans]